MAAVFLVTVYEYSPLFYIGLVSLCFVVTAAMVLGWFGFDVPVILRASDETESISPSPEKHMVQVTNPFALELGSGPACVTDGVTLRPCCLEPCVLTCFWGCDVSALQGALQAHQRSTRLNNCHLFHEALHCHYHYCQTFLIGKEDGEERLTQIPPEHSITDFGPLPRQCYPLVAVLTVSEEEATDLYSIVASVTVIHVPDDKYMMSARVLFQYLLTSQGNLYELKPLFMSAEGSGMSGNPDLQQGSHPGGPDHDSPNVEPSAVLQEEEEDDQLVAMVRGCVVCQNAAVNRVLLPCRHACVCDSCVSYFQHCPICRALILESFALTQESDSAIPP